MDKVKVFISSVMNGELEKERNKLIKTLDSSDPYEPVYGSNEIPLSSSPFVDSLKKVNESNIFVLILKYSYGAKYEDGPNPENLSLTHREYREAKSSNLPVLVCIYKRNDKWIPNQFKKEREPLLEEFILELKNGQTYATYYYFPLLNNCRELIKKVLGGLDQVRNEGLLEAQKYQKIQTRNETVNSGYHVRIMREING